MTFDVHRGAVLSRGRKQLGWELEWGLCFGLLWWKRIWDERQSSQFTGSNHSWWAWGMGHDRKMEIPSDKRASNNLLEEFYIFYYQRWAVWLNLLHLLEQQFGKKCFFLHYTFYFTWVMLLRSIATLEYSYLYVKFLNE